MALKQLVFNSLVCLLLITYVQYGYSQSKEDSIEPDEAEDLTESDEAVEPETEEDSTESDDAVEPETDGPGEGSNSMADAYVDYISGGLKPDVQVEDSNEGQEGGEQTVAENTDPYDDASSTMDMLLRNFKGQFKGLSDSKIKEKLADYVKEMDIDGDGSISEDELSKWIVKQGEKGAMTEDIDQLGRELVDQDKDGKVTWKEVEDDLKQYSTEGTDVIQFQKDTRFDKLKFQHADKNGDKVLDKEEYARYLMPEYFSDMTDYALAQYVAEYDDDNDWLITLDEFLKDLKGSSDKEAVTMETDRFNTMDANKDGKLSKDEVGSIALEYTIVVLANTEAKKLIKTSDENKDGVLSKAEILANSLAFTKGDTLDLEIEQQEHERHDEL